MAQPSPIRNLQEATVKATSVATQTVEPSIPVPLESFLVRQPLLDSNYQVAGYELRIRDKVPVPVLPGATSFRQIQDEMLLVSTADLEYQRALGNLLTFLGISPEALDNPLVKQLPASRIILALTEAEMTPGLMDRCEALTREGLSLAVDDISLTPEMVPLLRLCRYVRLDVTRYDVTGLIDRVRALRGLSGARLVARNVETEEAFFACRRLDFDLYQGYFFTRPQPGNPSRIDSSRQRILDLLNLVMGQAEIAQIEARFKTDAALSYKLLRLLNSPAFGLRRTIESIGQAVSMLGYEPLYRWLTLLLFTQGPADPRGQALLKTALIRARFTETLGDGMVPPAQQGGLFLVGILSTLDALLNLPMHQALDQLNLPQDVVDALTLETGIYAPYMKLVLACERFDQDTITSLAGEVGLSADQVNLAHVNAMIWAERLEV